MTVLAFISVLAGMLGATAAAFAGLWWGERGRRLALERWASHHGIVTRPAARVDGDVPRATPHVQHQGEHVVGKEPPAFDAATDQAVVKGLMLEYDIDEAMAQQVRTEIMDSLNSATGLPS